jgi:hypothetical protein
MSKIIPILIESEEALIQMEGDCWALFVGDDLYATGSVLDAIVEGKRHTCVRGKRTDACPISLYEVELRVGIALGIRADVARAQLLMLARGRESGWLE